MVQYDHTDGLGSPVARTNATGALVGGKTRYEAYGATAVGTAPGIGFTGHVNDAATGLVYMQQRYYDPIAGRFLSTDPVLTDANTGAGFNRYNYANNNPYSYIDPDGRAATNPYCSLGGGCGGNSGSRDDGGASNAPLPDLGRGPGPGAGSGAAVGAAAGFTLGVQISAGCDALTLGACVIANPVLISATTAIGALTGYIAMASTSNSGGDKQSGNSDEGESKVTRVTNPKHHPNSISPEPKNVDELFKKSIVDSNGVRWAKDADGTIHRFPKPSNGETHWNGSIKGVDPIKQRVIPIDIRRALGAN